jgi:hypothetical protein
MQQIVSVSQISNYKHYNNIVFSDLELQVISYNSSQLILQPDRLTRSSTFQDSHPAEIHRPRAVLSYLGKKVADRPAPHEIDGATHRSGDLGRRPVMTEVLLRSMSTASGRGRHG